MDDGFELMNWQEDFPIRGSIYSIEGFKVHWHSAVEILLVLQGNVSLGVGDHKYLLKENDLILINYNEIYSITRGKEDNLLLSLQIDPVTVSQYDPNFSRLVFDCKSFMYCKDNQEKFDVVRYYMAKVVWEYSKKKPGYQLRIASNIHLLAAHLVNNLTNENLNQLKSEIKDKDLARLKRILSYINENIDKKISLKTIAKNEHISYFYLSRFIKDNLGVTFQEYINTLRLDKAVNLLLSSNKTITEVSYESGFANIKLFNKLFKETFGASPLQYKKIHKESSEQKGYSDSLHHGQVSRVCLGVERKTAFKKLLSYLKPMDLQPQLSDKYKTNRINISVDVSTIEEPLNHYWKKLTTFSSASEGLRSQWQNQLKELQREGGFEYIRVHDVFSDRMMVCNFTEADTMAYNWSSVDELFDLFKSVNIKPFIGLGFVPSKLNKMDQPIFLWQDNRSPSQPMELWTELTREFIKHCINRYGLREVETWYFEVWKEPELPYGFWDGRNEEDFEFYRQTALTIKSIAPTLKVGGPGATYHMNQQSYWLEIFLTYCKDYSIPLDFVSLHIYPEDYIANEKECENISKMLQESKSKDAMKKWMDLKKIYLDKNYTFNAVDSAKKTILDVLNFNIETHITEWSVSTSYGNFIQDTSFLSTFIVKNTLDCVNKVDAIGYGAFTDLREEAKGGISSFHGGLGLMNKEGLKKPSYFAYHLLDKLGDGIIEKGEEYIITKKDENIQILAYNYAYFDEIFLKGDPSLLTSKERYLVFEEKPPNEINFNLSGLNGKYKITRYQLDRENGSVFDEWSKLGMVENMTKEELEYLQGRAGPKITVEYVEILGDYKGRILTSAHGIELITIDRQI